MVKNETNKQQAGNHSPQTNPKDAKQKALEDALRANLKRRKAASKPKQG